MTKTVRMACPSRGDSGPGVAADVGARADPRVAGGGGVDAAAGVGVEVAAMGKVPTAGEPGELGAVGEGVEVGALAAMGDLPLVQPVTSRTNARIDRSAARMAALFRPRG